MHPSTSTCHDGFTLYDLYSYNSKHNEKNGWNNTDGDNNGNSWNCGVEGDTDDPQIEGLRRRMVKNAFATLMCSRGPAMFYAGDEFCNTQFGNNNAYCQDNRISWLDWTRLDEYQEIHDFFRFMIAFRKKHAILRKPTKAAACGLPEISMHNGYPWNAGTDHNSRTIGVMYAGRNQEDTDDDIVFYGMNAYWEPLMMQLPELPDKRQWKVCVNTFVEYEDGLDVEPLTDFSYKHALKVPPRTAIVLVAEPRKKRRKATRKIHASDIVSFIKTARQLCCRAVFILPAGETLCCRYGEKQTFPKECGAVPRPAHDSC